MNSIDKNQSEKNKQDLPNADSIEKIRELGEGKTCFLCTSTGNKGFARPMTVQNVDKNGAIWFLSASDSNQNEEIKSNPQVNLYFQGSQYSEFMHLYGKASIHFDKEKVKELWNPIFKTWFTEGENDPRISLIKFSSDSGYYWDNKHGNFIAGIKMIIGAISGKTLDDSIQGSLNTK
ncbi:pyridoxamine 5'-phosphate oxidase family protein [uncultured Cytophaga sp.]|uniref:pyridoxamine 5'-phosphate oxidase family protein n=1 Tax=uncultured Cytophaga sp. TaxID=160238 RepID=UPI0026366C0F|nr:pyridoxamine 5'-phosphate oxidase family protein [uncultured Cytophaga sp.]